MDKRDREETPGQGQTATRLNRRLDAAAGYRESARTFFLWEGVTNYLTEAAVDTTLRWSARAVAGSTLLFTYIHRDVLVRPSAFAGTERLFAALESFGERFTFGIDPAQLRDFLAQRGFVLQSDIGAAEFRERYFHAAARRMRGHEFYRVALARVGRRTGMELHESGSMTWFR